MALSDPKVTRVAEAVSELAVQLFEQLRSRGLGLEPGGSDLLFLHSQNRTAYQDDPARLLMDQIVARLIEGNRGMLSSQIIYDRMLFSAICSAIRYPLDNLDLRQEATNEAQKLLLWKIHRNVDVPIVNLHVGDQPRSFGLATFHQIVGDDRTGPWWDWIKSHAAQFSDTEVVSYARVSSPGDLNNSIEYAIDNVSKMLTFLRGVGFPISTETQPEIGVLDELQIRRYQPLRLGEPIANFRLEFPSTTVMKLGPAVSPYDLQRDILDSVSVETLARLQRLFEEDFPTPRNEIKRKFFAGLKWLGEATKPDDLGARFAKLAFALESFVGGEAEDSTLAARGISATLSERGAFLAGNNSEQRLDIHQRIAKHYAQRSKVVHGHSQAIEESDFIGFAAVVRKVAWALLDQIDKFSNVESVQRWVLQQRYSVGIAADVR
jgi:hypothetical protein